MTSVIMADPCAPPRTERPAWSTPSLMGSWGPWTRRRCAATSRGARPAHGSWVTRSCSASWESGSRRWRARCRGAGPRSHRGAEQAGCGGVGAGGGKIAHAARWRPYCAHFASRADARGGQFSRRDREPPIGRLAVLEPPRRHRPRGRGGSLLVRFCNGALRRLRSASDLPTARGRSSPTPPRAARPAPHRPRPSAAASHCNRRDIARQTPAPSGAPPRTRPWPPPPPRS